MTKRIIDSMTADQIITGWRSSSLAEYIESICKPAPNWEDDASAENPILCWVSDGVLREEGSAWHEQDIDHITKINEIGYIGTSGFRWKYARPISPTECWQPTEQGNTK
tara:strand:+ start:50 stop:376 length:327 start_codon:yes stop_codon:yes gene_type:complete